MLATNPAQPVKVGRLLQSGIAGFRVAVAVGQIDAVAYGALVIVPASPDLSIYGVVSDIAFASDPLTKVMAGAIDIPPSAFESLRAQGANVEVSVFTVGYAANGSIVHGLPPRPPLGLDELHPCSDRQILDFTQEPLYLRHLFSKLGDPLVADLIAAHLGTVQAVHNRNGQRPWFARAIGALIEEKKKDPGMVRILLSLQATLPVEVLE
jgi:hypothetical protein